jgi:hypothetical protein
MIRSWNTIEIQFALIETNQTTRYESEGQEARIKADEYRDQRQKWRSLGPLEADCASSVGA